MILSESRTSPRLVFSQDIAELVFPVEMFVYVQADTEAEMGRENRAIIQPFGCNMLFSLRVG